MFVERWFESEKYYPEDYHPELMEDSPVDKPLYIPKEQVPRRMRRE